MTFVAFRAGEAFPVKSRWLPEKDTWWEWLPSFHSDLAEDNALALGDGDAEKRLAFASARPERPWLLWHCLLDSEPMRLFPARGERPALDGADERTRKMAAAFAENAQLLVAADGENGLPLLFLAYAEARKGFALGYDDDDRLVARLAAPEPAENAVRLVGLAAAKTRMTTYGRERNREWLTILGPPRTMVEMVDAATQLLRVPLLSHLLCQDLAASMTAAAAARIAEGGRDREKLAEGLRLVADLQRIGLLLVADAADLVTVMLGYHFIATACEDGARALLAAGMPAEAEELLARGRQLARPALLSRARRSLRAPDDQPPRSPLLLNDPTLRAEAEASLASGEAANAALSARVADNEFGFWLGLTMPSTDSWPAERTVFTQDELLAAGHLELWGFAKAGWTMLVSVVLAALLLGFIVSVIADLTENDAEPGPGPALSRIVPACLALGLAGAVPGLVVAEMGYRPTLPGTLSLIGLLFWTLWGVSAAGWLISRHVRPRPGPTGETDPKDARRSRLVLAFLLVSAPLFISIQSMRDEIPPLLFCMAAILIFSLSLSERNDGDAGERRKRFTLCLALMFVVWTALWFVVEWREKWWAERAVVVTPRPEDPVPAAIPAEGRLVHLHSREARARLAETNDVP